jgi:hypothetical protein
MKTLYERLTIEQQSTLEKGLIKFKFSYREMLDELNSTYFIRGLNFGKAIDLYWIFYPTESFNFKKFVNLFEDAR